MKIVMFAINPLFADKVIGGSTRHLQNVAVYLGQLGHEVTILCTQRPDTDVPFWWHERVQVVPCLQFKQPFPQPYDIPAYHIANNIQLVADYLAGADRFYMHDGELLFPPVYQDIPTVISLRDNVYPETMLGCFLFQADKLIAISDYSRQFYRHTAGRFLADLDERLVVIHNGIDWQQFKPTPPSKELLQLVGVDPQEHCLVLHPHRPEPSKGLPQTVAVVDLLVNQYQIPGIKVLVPRWFDAAISADVRAYYEQIETEIETRGLREHFVFHDWIPQALMPEYYSMGAVTLSLGHFVESFGNVVYESLGCGTLAIAARVSTHRELLPDSLLDKVHFDDAETAAALAARIINNKEYTKPETLAYLKEQYRIERQLAAYAEAILHTPKQAPMTYRFSPLNDQARYQLAPWCYRWQTYVYHDFEATHRQLDRLLFLLDKYPPGFTEAEAMTEAVSKAEVAGWYRQGYVVVTE